MDKGIDASLGLQVALMTLQRLRKSGKLQAMVSHIPGVQGRCRCTIELVGGKITLCMVEDATGNRSSVSVDSVVTADRKKGPFAWSFHPQAPPQTPRSIPDIRQASPAISGSYQPQAPLPPQFSGAIRDNATPVPLVRGPQFQLPDGLSANDKVMLGWIFSMVDGRRTVADIRTMLPRLRIEDVRNGLFYLKQLGVISLTE